MKKSELINLIESKVRVLLEKSVREVAMKPDELKLYINKVVNKKVPVMDAYKNICWNYKNYSQISDKDGRIEYGGGAFEQSLEKFGYVIKPTDIKNVDEIELWSWLSNIFYGTSSLNKLFPDITVQAIVQRLIKMKADDSYGGIKMQHRVPLAKQMKKLFTAAGLSDALI